MAATSKFHFSQAVVALQGRNLQKAEMEFKAVLDFQISGDVAVMTYFNIGQIHYNTSRERFNPNVALSGARLISAKKAYLYFEKAMELSKRFPSSPNFPDYASMLNTCEKNWISIGAYSSSIGGQRAR